MEKLNLKVHGMSCGHCVASVSNALKRLNGVRILSVGVGDASLAYEPGITTPDAIRQAVADAGYEAVAR